MNACCHEAESAQHPPVQHQGHDHHGGGPETFHNPAVLLVLRRAVEDFRGKLGYEHCFTAQHRNGEGIIFAGRVAVLQILGNCFLYRVGMGHGKSLNRAILLHNEHCAPIAEDRYAHACKLGQRQVVVDRLRQLARGLGQKALGVFPLTPFGHVAGHHVADRHPMVVRRGCALQLQAAAVLSGGRQSPHGRYGLS